MTTGAVRAPSRQTPSRVAGPVPSRVAWSFPPGRGPTITPSPVGREQGGSSTAPPSTEDVGTSSAAQQSQARRIDPQSSSQETPQSLPLITLKDFAQ